MRTRMAVIARVLSTERRVKGMLQPAQLYENELQEENIKSWYRPENMFWHDGTGECIIQLPDNNEERHCFVSIDKNDNVIGYIAYCVNWVSMSANRWGIISFKKGSVEFAKDLYKAISDCFITYHLNRISWSCYEDNPALRGYRNFIKRHGGRECGYHRQVTRLRDGKLHNAVEFEILAEEFKNCEKLEGGAE